MRWPPQNLDELLKRSAQILHTAGATAVYVFGSAASGRMHQDSDVDLAVSGLPPRDYIPAKVQLGNLFGRSVDLVDLDLETPFTSYLKTKAGALRRVATSVWDVEVEPNFLIGVDVDGCLQRRCTWDHGEGFCAQPSSGPPPFDATRRFESPAGISRSGRE